MKKIVFGIVVAAFVLFAVLITANMLSLNEYGVAEFGEKSLVISNDNMKQYGYKNSDLLVISKVANDDIKVGDTIIFYNNYEDEVSIEQSSISEISSNGKQFYLDSNNSISYGNVLGTKKTTKVYPTVGRVLKVLETSTGYLLIIVLPTLILFTYLIRKVTVELKEEKKNN